MWNYKVLKAVSLHERNMDRMVDCYRKIYALLAFGAWPFTNLKHKIYRLDKFDLAQEEIIIKLGGIIKGLIDCTLWEK